jgi:hypothetical protein
MYRLGDYQAGLYSGYSGRMQTFYLAGVATGTHNLVITTTNHQTNSFYAHCVSYGGVDQDVPIESFQQQTDSNVSANNNVSVSLASLTDEAWVGMMVSDVRGRTVVSGASTTKISGCSDPQTDCFDTNGPVSPGTTTLNFLATNGQDDFLTSVYAIRPAAAHASYLLSTSLQVSPVFSGLFRTSSSTALATSYQLQIATSSSFAVSTFWDSGKQTLSSSTPAGQRSPWISSVASLASGITYYWRIKFWDQMNNEGYWSGTAPFFTISN